MERIGGEEGEKGKRRKKKLKYTQLHTQHSTTPQHTHHYIHTTPHHTHKTHTALHYTTSPTQNTHILPHTHTYVRTLPGSLLDALTSVSGSSGNSDVASSLAASSESAPIVISFSNNILWKEDSVATFSSDATLILRERRGGEGVGGERGGREGRGGREREK